MTDEERATYWVATRRKMEAGGWVLVEPSTGLPHPSPDNPGNFFKGEWGWRLCPVSHAVKNESPKGETEEIETLAAVS